MLEELQVFGLSEVESKVFISLNKHSPCSINILYKDCDIRRTTCYEILERLTGKGIVTHFIADGVKHFQAVAPEILIEKIEEKKKIIQSIIPDLHKLRSFETQKSSTQIYLGKMAIKTIFDDILAHKMDYCTYANADVFEKLNQYFPRFIERRKRLGIHAKVIEEKTALTRQHKQLESKENREIRFSQIRFDSNVFIYGHKVAFLTLKDDDIVGFVIENNVVANTQKQVFDILWDNATE